MFQNKIIALLVLVGSQVATSSIHNTLLLLIIVCLCILILKMRSLINDMCFWTKLRMSISQAFLAGKVFVSATPGCCQWTTSAGLPGGVSRLPRGALRLRTCARRSSHERGH